MQQHRVTGAGFFLPTVATIAITRGDVMAIIAITWGVVLSLPSIFVLSGRSHCAGLHAFTAAAISDSSRQQHRLAELRMASPMDSLLAVCPFDSAQCVPGDFDFRPHMVDKKESKKDGSDAPAASQGH